MWKIRVNSTRPDPQPDWPEPFLTRLKWPVLTRNPMSRPDPTDLPCLPPTHHQSKPKSQTSIADPHQNPWSCRSKTTRTNTNPHWNPTTLIHTETHQNCLPTPPHHRKDHDWEKKGTWELKRGLRVERMRESEKVMRRKGEKKESQKKEGPVWGWKRETKNK